MSSVDCDDTLPVRQNSVKRSRDDIVDEYIAEPESKLPKIEETHGDTDTHSSRLLPYVVEEASYPEPIIGSAVIGSNVKDIALKVLRFEIAASIVEFVKRPAEPFFEPGVDENGEPNGEFKPFHHFSTESWNMKHCEKSSIKKNVKKSRRMKKKGRIDESDSDEEYIPESMQVETGPSRSMKSVHPLEQKWIEDNDIVAGDNLLATDKNSYESAFLDPFRFGGNVLIQVSIVDTGYVTLNMIACAMEQVLRMKLDEDLIRDLDMKKVLERQGSPSGYETIGDLLCSKIIFENARYPDLAFVRPHERNVEFRLSSHTPQ